MTPHNVSNKTRRSVSSLGACRIQEVTDLWLATVRSKDNRVGTVTIAASARVREILLKHVQLPD